MTRNGCKMTSSKSCLFNFRTDFRSDDRNLFSNSHLTKYIMHLKHIFFSFIGTKMRLISVVICGLFYSALANDEKQAKSIFFFFFCYCYSFTKVPVSSFFRYWHLQCCQISECRLCRFKFQCEYF